MDGNTAFAGNEADNIVGWRGFAAFGKRGHQTVFAIDKDSLVLPPFLILDCLTMVVSLDRYGRRFVQRAAGFLDGAVGKFRLSAAV